VGVEADLLNNFDAASLLIALDSTAPKSEASSSLDMVTDPRTALTLLCLTRVDAGALAEMRVKLGFLA
jgi:hypothetical protein